MAEPRREATARARPPSMADVAARVGVSHQTVSRVLNGSTLVRDETRRRVLAAIDELGYRRNQAARALATNRSGQLGLVVSHLALHGPSMMAASVQEAARAAGYEAAVVGVLEFSPATLRGAVERLLDQSVEAVLIAVAHRETVPMVEHLGVPVPVVLVQGLRHETPMGAAIDQVGGARLATGHLLDLGHRSVATVTGPSDWIEAAQRREGWLAAHEERGVLPGPELAGDWSAQSGRRAGVRIAADPLVTAVLAGNDAMALGLLSAMHEAGRRVPEDISVVGFDNVPEAAFYWPPLTTVDQPFSVLGEVAVDLALRALAGEDGPSTALLPAGLVQRSSTGPPPSR